MKKILFILFIVNCTLVIDNCYAQWVWMSNGLGNQEVYSLAVNSNHIFAGTYNGVYISANNGTSWTQTTLNDQWVKSLAANGNNIFAGTYNNGVYKSTNNGTSWIQTSINNQFVLSLAIKGNNIFAGTYGNGVFLSSNNGTNWVQTSLNNQYFYSLAVNGNNIFAGTNGNGVYISTNNASSWAHTALNNEGFLSLAVNENNIFAGTFMGVYKSTDNGTNWTQTSLGNLIVVYSLATSLNTIFAGTISYNNNFYVSNDNGANWIQRNEGLNGVTVNALCILNNYIFAGSSDNSVYRRPLGELIGIQAIANEIPTQFSLSQNYPNPFNPSTKIQFALPKSSLATLVVYDVLGREMETLVNEQVNAGTYEVDWSADKFSSGVYYYKLIAGDFVETKKMVLIK